MKRVHVIISGRVQGVWFRQSTMEAASGLGLSGWVRNLSDDSVEAVFEGSAGEIEKMLAWCKEGPPLAQVTEIREIENPETANLPSPFEIR